MAFATTTAQKIGKYLGYPATDSSQQTISAVLTAITAIANADFRAGAEATIEGYLTTLDTLSGKIVTEAQLEGSTLLPELRKEYRRHCTLVAVATGLEVYADTAGSSGV